MKKILSDILIVVLVLCTIFSADRYVSASEMPEVLTGNAKEQAGKSVQIPVQIKNNPGITAFRLVIEYDAVILKLTDVEFKEAAEGFNTGTSQSYDSPYSISGYNSSTDINNNGTVAIFTFEIRGSAEPGRYPISLSYDADDVFNIKGESIYFEVEEGYVEVLSDNVSTSVPSDGPSKDAPSGGNTHEPNNTSGPVSTQKPDNTEMSTTTPTPAVTIQPSDNTYAGGNVFGQIPESAPAAPVKDNVSINTLNTGDRILYGNIYYKITDSQKKTAEAAGLKANVKKVVIPAVITVAGETYKVTSVAANAFKGKKLKEVIIGKNVAFVGEKAFLKCSSLKKVVIKSLKLRSIGKNTFKKISRKAVIKVPKKKVKKYKSMLKIRQVK